MLLSKNCPYSSLALFTFLLFFLLFFINTSMFGGLFDKEREKGLYGTWKETNTKNVFNISLCEEFKKKKKIKKK